MTDEAYLNPPAGIGCRNCYDADEGCAECRPNGFCMAIMGGCGCVDRCKVSTPVNTTEVQDGLDIQRDGDH